MLFVYISLVYRKRYFSQSLRGDLNESWNHDLGLNFFGSSMPLVAEEILVSWQKMPLILLGVEIL